MEKRLFYAFLITFVFLIWYSRFTAKFSSSPQPQEEQSRQAKPSLPEAVVPETTELKQVFMGGFTITYSARGGYVKKLLVNKYQEDLIFEDIGFTGHDKDKTFKVQVFSDRILFTSPERKKEFVFGEYTISINISPLPREMLLFTNLPATAGLDQRYQEVFYSQKKILRRTNVRKIKEGVYEEIDFAGARDRYYCISLLKDRYKIRWQKEKDKTRLYLVPSSSKTHLYVGPQAEKNLQLLDLQGIMHYGFFHGIGVVLIKLLYFFWGITKSWGGSIILLSGAIFLALFPFTMKSTKAMKKMQEMQPHIDELKTKHKDNPQKLQKETMEIYKKHKINPLGGCLPLFFQLPVFLALYQVLLRFVELKGAPFLWIKDLSLADRAIALPFTLPFLGSYLNLLPLFIVIVGLIQQKFINPSSGTSQQKSMGLFFAVFLGVIFYNFPSCIVLYWLVQSSFSLIYQMRIART